MNEPEERKLDNRIWESAIRDAADLLAAYIVPDTYGLDVTPASVATGEEPSFTMMVKRRIEFGQAVRVIELLETWKYLPSARYEHRVFWSQGILAGKLHIPKYLATRSRTAVLGIPVIRASKESRTPENLLVSEVLQRTRTILGFWKRLGGAEARQAQAYLHRLSRIESREPWQTLRSKPRPALRELGQAVRARVVARVVEPQPILSLVNLVLTKEPSKAFELGAGPLSFYASRDYRFEDRLFELLCLGWMLGAIQRSTGREAVQIFPERLRSNDGKPVLDATISGIRVRIIYQSGQPIPTRNWIYSKVLPKTANQNRVGNSLRAIFDYVVEIERNGATETIIVDAKNREPDQSEIIYKLLGYKENTHNGIQPFVAAAVFPGYRDEFGLVELKSGESRVYLLEVPLSRGRRTFVHLLRLLLQKDTIPS